MSNNPTPKKSPKVRLQSMVDPTVKVWLELASQRTGFSVSKILEIVITEYIREGGEL